MVQYQNKNEWLEGAREAATHMNAADAYKIIRTWPEFIGQPIELPQNDQYMEGLRQNLLLTAFAVLNEEQAVAVLRVLTKQFFAKSEYQLPPQQKIEDRLVVAGYGFYEEERLRLQGALRASAASIGGKLLQEWLSNFESFRPAREERKVEEFLLQSFDGVSAAKAEQVLLGEVLRVYDSYLQYPVFNIYDYAVLEGTVIQAQRLDVLQENNSVEKLTLLKALSKYSDIGSQVITTDRVKLKGQTEPVRGSITNWLKVYRDELGIGRHDAVTRAQFLYESINTKKLPPEDREKVHALVRSLEDEELLAIDIKTRSLIFFEEKKIPQQTFQATQIAGNKAATEGAPQDLFERFAGTSSPMQSATQPRLEPRTKPANTLPTPLYGVGTSKFGAVTQRPEKTREEELGLLERIKKMKTARLPEIPPHEREPGESLPLGKLTFSGSQVFSGEKAKQPSVSPQTMMVAPDSSPSTMLVADQERTPSWSNQKPTPPHAISVQAFPQKRIAPLAPEAQPVASKRVSSPASVFRIKPNRE
jgi:hypothetical protein